MTYGRELDKRYWHRHQHSKYSCCTPCPCHWFGTIAQYGDAQSVSVMSQREEPSGSRKHNKFLPLLFCILQKVSLTLGHMCHNAPENPMTNWHCIEAGNPSIVRTRLSCAGSQGGLRLSSLRQEVHNLDMSCTVPVISPFIFSPGDNNVHL